MAAENESRISGNALVWSRLTVHDQMKRCWSQSNHAFQPIKCSIVARNTNSENRPSTRSISIGQNGEPSWSKSNWRRSQKCDDQAAEVEQDRVLTWPAKQDHQQDLQEKGDDDSGCQMGFVGEGGDS
jgi:hypothetical protein